MKRIVICCDGTWNRPDQTDLGRACPTNVAKLAFAVLPQGPDGTEQRVYYHPGVGTRRIDRFRGGAFGWGLSRNIKDAYLYLIENFEPCDELYFFGFSRGAYTVRSLAGLIRNSGLLRRQYARKVEDAYGLYRGRGNTSHPNSLQARLFRATYARDVPIKCLGVWDTVGSLGLPGLMLPLIQRHIRFHDVDLSSHVQNAFQALAIDEKRRFFAPSVWRQQPASRGAQRLEQVWFAGVHCNVGGGYCDSGLSDLALAWMIDRARSCDLAIDERALPEEVTYKADVAGALRDSMTNFYRLFGAFVRPVPTEDPSLSMELVHPSVYERKRLDPKYTPANLR